MPDERRRRAEVPPRGVAFRRVRTYIPPLTRRPGSRWYAGNGMLEESPGSMETGRRVTPARRKPRESATESRPPILILSLSKDGLVRVKGWGKSPPRGRQRPWHGKPRPEQDRIGGAYGPFPARAPGVSREGSCERAPRGMAAQARKRWTEPGLQAVWSEFLSGTDLATPCPLRRS